MTKFWTLPLKLKAAGGPFDDPALLVAPTNSELSILFDCGTLHGLKTRDLQKVRWLFLSHLHIDHLIGFDHLLRVRLFSALPLTVYGPPGTLQAIGHRLKGYAWNLTGGSPFRIRVFECRAEVQQGAEFLCQHQFEPGVLDQTASAESPDALGTVALGDGIKVSCHLLQHGVPCLAYRLDRETPPKFSLETAASLGLSAGPWISRLVSGQPVQQIVDGAARDQDWLAERLLTPSARHSLGYLTDTRLDQRLADELADFFKGVDVLCSETAYLQSERSLATQNMHMTTVQVAALATAAEAGQLRIFHISRRHCEAGSERHLAEVRQVFAHAALLESSRAASESLS